MFSLLTLLGAFKVHLILTNSLSNIKIQLVSSNFGMGLLCDVTPSYIIQRSHYVSLSWKQTVSQQTVVLQIWQKNEKIDMYDFPLHMIR